MKSVRTPGGMHFVCIALQLKNIMSLFYICRCIWIKKLEAGEGWKGCIDMGGGVKETTNRGADFKLKKTTFFSKKAKPLYLELDLRIVNAPLDATAYSNPSPLTTKVAGTYGQVQNIAHAHARTLCRTRTPTHALALTTNAP